MRWLRQGNPPAADSSQLASVRIFTREVHLTGVLATTGQRVTDMLVRGTDLAFLPSGADPAPDNWLTISPSHVLLVVPPPLPSRPEWRVTVQQHKVYVRIDRFQVTGTAHLAPGVEVDDELRRTQPFLPLTDAFLSPGDGEEPEFLEVLIVNLEASTEYRVTE